MRGKPDDSPVVTAVQRDLAKMPAFADSGLAALVLAMAAEVDDRENAGSVKASCAKAMTDALRELRTLAPVAKESDRLDDLAARRDQRRSRA